jgi:hypothetical protein
LALGNSIAKLVQKNSEMNKEKLNFEQQVEKYKNTVRDLGMKIQTLEKQVEMMKQQNLRLEQQRTSTSQPDKKPSIEKLQQQQSQQSDQKPDVNKLEHSEKPPTQNPQSKSSQPNFLEKYEYKKLNHFERMQQERGHETKNLIEPEVSKVETDCPDDGEETGELLEVNTFITFKK